MCRSRLIGGGDGADLFFSRLKTPLFLESFLKLEQFHKYKLCIKFLPKESSLLHAKIEHNQWGATDVCNILKNVLSMEPSTNKYIYGIYYGKGNSTTVLDWATTITYGAVVIAPSILHLCLPLRTCPLNPPVAGVEREELTWIFTYLPSIDLPSRLLTLYWRILSIMVKSIGTQQSCDGEQDNHYWLIKEQSWCMYKNGSQDTRC